MRTSVPSSFSQRRDRQSVVLTGARWAAALVIINGLVSLIATLAGQTRYPPLALGLMPMPPVLALAHIANGLALWAFLRRRRAWHLGGAGIALLLGVFALISVSRPPGTTTLSASVAGSLLAVFASVALVTAWIRGRSGLVHITFGVSGLVLLSLSITVIGVRLIGPLGPDTERIFIGASGQGVTSSIVLSLCFLSLVWAEGFGTTEPPRWVAAAAGIASLLAVLLLWRALDARESEQLRSQTLLAASTERDAVYRESHSMAASLRRAAEGAATGVTAVQENGDLAALVRDLPGLIAALRIAENGSVAAGAPRNFDATAVAEAWRRNEKQLGGFDTLSFAPIEGRADRFAVVSPICSEGSCKGAVVGVIDAPGFFARALADPFGGFLFMVSRDGHVLGTDSLQLPSSFWRQDLALQLGAAHWELSAIPTNETLRQMRTTLPTSVLFMGLIVSALLPVTLLLGQEAWRSARISERARLSSALERATDGIWEWNLVTGEIQRSASFYRHLGYDPDALMPGAAGWRALIHPDDSDGVQRAFDRHISGASPTFEAEYRVRDWSGNWHIIVDRGRVVDRMPDGRAARIVGIRADVTESRRSDEAREMSERRFRTIFDSGFQCKLLLEANGRVLEVNRACLDLAGTPGRLVLDRPVWDTLWWQSDPDSAGRLRAAVAAALGGATVLYEDDVPVQGGARFTLEIGLKSVSPIPGRSAQLLLEARDVTAKRRMEVALQELDTLAAMGRIAARVAHEINNPLAGIQYSFLLVKDAIPRDHPHFKYVGAIEREISRIGSVTRQLYETYSPEKEIASTASLSTIIGDAVSFLEQVNRSAAVKIETDLSGAPSIVPVASAVLRQIVYNLVQNAVDASPPNETVRITAVATREILEIRVVDRGPGIAPELRARVFEPFFSTKDTRTRTSGMGLGLALVRQTVTSAGGTIRIEQAPDGGALFIVTLPLTTETRTEVA